MATCRRIWGGTASDNLVPETYVLGRDFFVSWAIAELWRNRHVYEE